MGVMHSFPSKLRRVFRWMFAARRHGPVVAVAIVVMMIDMSVEMFRPMEPRASADEYSAREPLRAIVAARRAIVRGSLVVAIRTNGGHSNFDADLRVRVVAGSHE